MSTKLEEHLFDRIMLYRQRQRQADEHRMASYGTQAEGLYGLDVNHAKEVERELIQILKIILREEE